MGSVGCWLRGHNWDAISLREEAVTLLKDLWLGVLLLFLGAVAFVTAVILAYPVMARIWS